MLLDPTLYLTAALLYGVQTHDALLHRHPCAAYAGLTAVHLAMALHKLLLHG